MWCIYKVSGVLRLACQPSLSLEKQKNKTPATKTATATTAKKHFSANELLPLKNISWSSSSSSQLCGRWGRRFSRHHLIMCSFVCVRACLCITCAHVWLCLCYNAVNLWVILFLMQLLYTVRLSALLSHTQIHSLSSGCSGMLRSYIMERTIAIVVIV